MGTFILIVLTATLLGYGTNLLAVRMLFRPRTEKRFLGYRLPMTPGVIPRERQKIIDFARERGTGHPPLQIGIRHLLLAQKHGNPVTASQVVVPKPQRIDLALRRFPRGLLPEY